MNSKRQPTVWANDFCDQHGYVRVCPDDLELLRSFVRWIDTEGHRSGWDACKDYWWMVDDLELAHHAFHTVVIVPCHLTDLRLLQDGAIHAPRGHT